MSNNQNIKDSQKKTNKLFTKDATLKSIGTATPYHVSKIRLNREYLLSKHTAEELNTYISFDPFPVFNDGYTTDEKDENGNIIKGSGPGTPGVRSIFNKAGAVVIGTDNGKVSTQQILNSTASEWRVSNNVPLMDNIATRQAIREHSGCSVKELVIASSKGDLGRETYDFSDFMYCKYLGKIPNNYLITLRRFPLPVDDYISTMGTTIEVRRNKEIQSQNSQSIGCLVTWMGTPGNEMSNILKYSYSMPYKEQQAQWEQDSSNADAGSHGILNGIAATFDSQYQKQYAAGQASSAANAFIGKFFKPGTAPYNIADINNWQDRNKVYGPVDAIKSVYMRGDDGIKFNQDITLTFEYELRSYNGINGRQAMLDLLSNILNVTYTTGTFWGGGYRGTGAHQNNIFTNLQVFKTAGGATDFYDAFTKDISTIGGAVKSNIKSNGGLWNTVKNFMNNLGGMFLGGFLNALGRPQKAMVNSLLSPAPVGFWHLTIGNPHHPIMSMGNMILKETTIEHYGPLGLDDFPTGLKVTCTLTRGKPRDLRDIEKIYMHGNDRIYTSMGPKVFEMYKRSKEYKNKESVNNKFKAQIEGADAQNIGPGLEGHLTVSDIKEMSGVLQKYFGQTDTYSIYVAACEQENGAHKKKKTGSAGGDSRAKGTGKTIKPA